MIAHRLKQSFDRFYPAPLRVWENFASFCEIVHFRKNEIIKAADTRETHGYFILEGSAGCFAWKEAQYVCLDMFFENEFFGDSMSLNTGEASPVETRVFEDSRMLQISLANMERLKESEIGKKLFMVGAEMDYVFKQQQQMDLLFKTAEERYQDLLEEYPNIILRIPQKYIASYLGITTQSLSRIRRKIRVA